MIDDNATNRRILVQMLHGAGMRPAATDSGASGLLMLKEAHDAGSRYDVIILDHQMPEMDGFEFLNRQAAAHHTPRRVALLTSGDSRGDLARCRDLGVAAYLTKPIAQSELIDAIAVILGRQVESRRYANAHAPRSSPDA